MAARTRVIAPLSLIYVTCVKGTLFTPLTYITLGVVLAKPGPVERTLVYAEYRYPFCDLFGHVWQQSWGAIQSIYLAWGSFQKEKARASNIFFYDVKGTIFFERTMVTSL